MLKNILVVLNNGVQFEIVNVVEFATNNNGFTEIVEKSGQEHYINTSSLAFLSVKSSIETPTITLNA